MRLLLALLLLGSIAEAGQVRSNASRKVWSKPQTMPADIRWALTFYAPLENGTGATGAGADTRATFTRATIATYIHPTTGLVTQVASGTPRFEANGYLSEGARTNLALYSDDFTQAATWVVSGAGNDEITVAKTSTGPDGVANSASRLTSAATDSTIKQSITSGSAARVTSCWIKRITGTGVVNMTQDDGATWTPLTLTTSWARYSIAAQTTANPIIGLQIVTSGDAIDVSLFQHEVGAFVSSAIPTVAAAVTRNVDQLTYPPAGNLTAGGPGTASIIMDIDSTISGSANKVGLSTQTSGSIRGVILMATTAPAPRALVSEAATQADITASGDNFAAGVKKRMAIAYATNDFQLTTAGVSRGTDSAGDVPALASAITVGAPTNLGTPAFGHVMSVSLFASRLSAFDMSRLR